MTTMQKLFSKFRKTDGYTIDQTILIVAIIAILITLVIMTVGWNMLNKANGTKLAAQLRQVEDAIGSFYSDNKVWPNVSYSGTATLSLNARALTGNMPAANPYLATVTVQKNYLPGFKLNSGLPVHAFSNNGGISVAAMTDPYGLTGTYLVVQFSAVPYTQAVEAETAIDGTTTPVAADFQSGRFTAATGSSCLVTTPAAMTIPVTGNVNVCYAANSTM